jgi:co-chaperonin GroES (HSP10)
MKVRAIGHRIVVKPDPVEEKTAGGIVLAIDTKRERAAVQKGTVLDIGPLAWTNEVIFGKSAKPWCRVGDRVFFARYGGKMINLNEDTTQEPDNVVILNDEDLQALIEDEIIGE